MKPIALIDLDNTVADYHGAMQRDLESLASTPEEIMTRHEDGKEPPWLKARIQLVRNQPLWWQNLPVLPRGMAIVAVLRELGFDLHVLTKGPYKHPAAWTEKVSWCREHIADAKVTITEDKGLIYGAALVDDWPNYGVSWLRWRPRGLLIVPAQPWNELDQYPEELRGQIFRFEHDSLGAQKALRGRLHEQLSRKKKEEIE